MGIPERKAREFKRRENTILDAAFRLFDEKGLENVTIEMIANAAEIGKGTIYKHFKSKHDIYAHLIIRQGEDVIELFERNVDSVAPIERQIRQYIRTYVSFFNADFGMYKICKRLEEVLTMEQLSPDVRDELNSVYQNKMALVEAVMHKAADEGLLMDTAASISDLAHLFAKMLLGALDATFNGKVKEVEKIADIITDILINGFMRHS